MPSWLFPRTRSVWYGLTLPWQAFRLIISHPTLIAWSLLPIGVTIAIYVYVIAALQDSARGLLVSYFATWGLDPQGIFAVGLLILTKIVLFLVGAFTFSFVASITASPFNDFLAESTEKWTQPALPAVTEKGVGNKLKLIGIDLGKTIAATVATILAMLLSLVPVINAVAFVVAFLLVTFQYISYAQTRRGLGLGAGARFIVRHFYACAGFGATLSVLFAIPFVASLSLPLAVVGGTLLVARAPGIKGSKDFPPLK
jgi:uncharacterized protein involved in cysteine biosynthesis